MTTANYTPPRYILAVLVFLTIPGLSVRAQEPSSDQRQIELRAWWVPTATGTDVNTKAKIEIMNAFRRRCPNVTLVYPTGLDIPGLDMDVVPLMQIAGDIAPDVLRIVFRQSHTYIAQKFLYPLDKYIEEAVGIKGGIPDGHLLSLDEYLVRLKAAPRYKAELEQRVPYQCWLVMRRRCPYTEEGDECMHLAQWGVADTREPHYHVWCFPMGPSVMAMSYSKALLAEAGLPDRVPDNWDELLEWARKLTNPPEDRYGLKMYLDELGWGTMSFLYSMGGLIVDQSDDGNWKFVFDSEEAVEAYYFVARLFLEPFENEYGKWDSVVSTGEGRTGEPQCALEFQYIDQRFFSRRDPSQWGFGPVPAGPTGKRGNEFNSEMAGIYADLVDDKFKRDIAWEFIRFFDGPEARLIRASVFVENGLGQYVQPALLREAGYTEYVRLVPKAWEQAFQQAVEAGIPEPYGKNCQLAYKFVSRAIDQDPYRRPDKKVHPGRRRNPGQRPHQAYPEETCQTQQRETAQYPQPPGPAVPTAGGYDCRRRYPRRVCYRISQGLQHICAGQRNHSRAEAKPMGVWQV